MGTPGQTTRRTFVKSAAASAAGLLIVPRHVLGGPGHRPPSDTLNIACVGVGGKGWEDAHGVAGERIVALCDVDDERAARTYTRFPDANRYRDFRRMLDAEPGLDAVTVSTADHTHAVIAIAAMLAGKHVFCQKPLTRTIAEVRKLMDVARETGVVTQMGNQGHADEGTRQIREIIEAGLIGAVREVHFWTDRPIWPQALDRPEESHPVPAHLDWDLWLGPAPYRPFHTDYYAPFNWRGWWDFGTGALGDIGCHVMDAAFWALDLRNPARIEAETTTRFEETAPAVSRVTYQFPATPARPAVSATWRDGTLGFPRLPEIDAPFPNPENGQLFVGEKGLLAAGWLGENPRLYPSRLHDEVMSNPPAPKYARTPGVYLEWIEAIKQGGRAGSDFVEHSGPLTELVLLGNLAVRTGEVIEWDSAQMRVTSSDAANAFVGEAARPGWEI
jgi:predicted dehydrogenase